MISITINANVVAIYAAIVSTLVLIIQFLNYWNDRINIVLDYKTDYKIHGENYNPDKSYLLLTIRNKGKRPVTIEKVGYIANNKEDAHGIFTNSVLYGSRELSEGKATKYIVDQEEINLDKINYFVAYDQAGREYKCEV